MSHLNYRKVDEVTATFHNHSIGYDLMDYKMVMAAKDQVDPRNCFSQFHVVVFHHVSQSNYHITVQLLPEFLHHSFCEIDKWNVVAYLLIGSIECVQPLFLC